MYTVQKFKAYSIALKKEAIRLHVEEKLTYRRIMEHLEVQDADRVKKWRRKYREQGDEKFTNHLNSLLAIVTVLDMLSW
ncbi:helix-turn-helix domain-containing protein [Paenibacillus lautus]